MRGFTWLLIVLALPCGSRWAEAQMDAATLAGRVLDSVGNGVSKAKVELEDIDRGTRRTAFTDNVGFYVFAEVRPGHYRVQVSAPGFNTVSLTSLTIYTQDEIQETFRLSTGSLERSVTFDANGAQIKTSGTVGTVIEPELISELPLNGLSFQTLFQLAPGVVVTPTSFASQGQLSINGQRTDTNYLVVDGVSANFSIAGGVNPGQSAGGWLPALSVFGSTNSLVSTSDVQEFAILTSSYSAEFGRVPGGQVSIVTRSGTNKLNGSVFDYLRNDAFDANDWFANNEGLPRAALRQNDFGGVLGGPVIHNRTFFVASFEGLQLRQPTSSSAEVPSLAARNSAAAAVKPFLDAYPIPNGPDEGNGLALATYGFSNPSSLDAVSLRIDHHIRKSLTTFVRYAYSVSDTQQRGGGSESLSTVTNTHFGQQTLTGGLVYSINPRTTNDLRVNWSAASAASNERLGNFGGAIPLDPQLVFPPSFSVKTSLFQFVPAIAQQSAGLGLGRNVSNAQAQVNVIDDLSWQVRGHLIKVGVDFRNLLPEVTPATYQEQDAFQNIQTAVENNDATVLIVGTVPVHADFKNYSAFSEDTWRASEPLTITVGIRWDSAPTPTIKGANGLEPFAVEGFNNLPNLTLAPLGTPLYRSSMTNFAPRIGFAYEVRRSGRTASVLRGGAGVYYDLSNGPVGATLSGFSFPFVAESFVSAASLPLSPGLALAPPITTSPPFRSIQAFPPVLRTPYTYQWSLSLDQAIGNDQTIGLSYVGAAGHRLLRTEEYMGGEAAVPATFSQVLLTENSGYSNYNSLQIKFERRSKQAHVIASYCLAHSLDNVSTDEIFDGVPAQFINPRTDYGPSDFDIRQTATLGLDYAPPRIIKFGSFLKSGFSGWFVDPIVIIRSAPPVTPVVSRDIGFGTYDFRPDLIPGIPLYMVGPDFPGGRAINLAALAVPAAAQQGDLGRNFFRGFPLFQTDLAVRRSFSVTQRFHLQARVEAFNLFNHPNFAPPTALLGTVTPRGNFIPQQGFGVSPSTLAQGLEGGFGSGFSPLYQVGGGRSLQLALRAEF